MPFDITVRGLRLQIDEAQDPGEQPELGFRHVQSATEAWTLASVKGEAESAFGGALSFSTNPGGAAPGDAPVERMRIGKDGNVGIGAPPDAAYRLNVGGALNATAVHVNGSPLVTSQWQDVPGGLTFAGALTIGALHLVQEGIAAIHYGNRGKFGDAVHFNPDNDRNGLWIEGSSNEDESESGGLFMNDNTLCLWSPGDNDLLRVYDEDDFLLARPLPKFVISGDGNVGIGTDAPGFRLDVADRMRVRQGDSPSAAIWFHQAGPNADRAAVGMANDNQVGFWGNDGAGWGLLMDTTSGNVGIGTRSPQGRLDVQGDIRAGDSSLYFTKVDHNHSGIGNTAGWAAIENAADYGALMILGRAGTDKGRYVRLWDYLQVNGSLDITGNLGVGTATPTHRFHVVAHDAVGLLESTGTTAYLRLTTREGINNRVEITNRPGGVLTLWTAGGGDTFRIERNGRIHIGGNLNGAFVQFNDDLWFSDPQNGTTHVLNAAFNWGTMIGHFLPPSSIEYKKEVAPLRAADWRNLLDDALKTDLVNFKYKGDADTDRSRLGVIVEQCPAYLVGEDGKSLSTAEYVAMLHGAIKALAQQLQAYQAQTATRLDTLAASVAGTA